MNAHRPKLAIIDLSHEQAMDAIEKLDCREDLSNNEMTIARGAHPEFGLVYIVIPPSGESLVLPLVIRNFDV